MQRKNSYDTIMNTVDIYRSNEVFRSKSMSPRGRRRSRSNRRSSFKRNLMDRLNEFLAEYYPGTKGQKANPVYRLYNGVYGENDPEGGREGAVVGGTNVVDGLQVVGPQGHELCVFGYIQRG